ncbi:MAG: L,D-transpeptidase family protein [Croceibacterium sp.]
MTRPFLTTACMAAAGIALLMAPVVAQAETAVAVPISTPARAVSVLQADRLAKAPTELRSYYAYYGSQPLWISADGNVNAAAHALLKLVQTAQFDDVDPTSLGADQLAAAVERAESERTPAALTDAELQLSAALVAYETAMRQRRVGGMTYEHPNLQPFAANGQSILHDAATSASLTDYISQLQWMHPLYGSLRAALVGDTVVANRQAIVKNLERLREIPRSPAARYILVDAASARLFMYEGDHVVDSMRVVVGKPEMATPSLAGYVRYATFNPYWYVPSDLVPKRIAPNVLSQGMPYLKRQGYQVVSEFSDDAQVLDASKVNWRAVAAGTEQVKIRQQPGGANAMGKVKYEFPNAFGIYLHDTPERELLAEDARQFSSGCIRLEDAQRLGRWLMGDSMPQTVIGTEQRMDLAQPVPVYVTYITASVTDGQVAIGPDPYARDVAPDVQPRALALVAN